MYASLHGDPNRAYPYFTGHADEQGAGPGAGTTLNVPLPPDVDDDAYLAALEKVVDAIDRFDPAVLVVSLGVDTYRLDPICDFQITTEGFTAQARADRRARASDRRAAGGRLPPGRHRQERPRLPARPAARLRRSAAADRAAVGDVGRFEQEPLAGGEERGQLGRQHLVLAPARAARRVLVGEDPPLDAALATAACSG